MYLVTKDLFHYWRLKLYLEFYGWGLHLYVGRFGQGKTIAMVRDAYLKACRYPQLNIVTNLKLMNFPENTNVLPLRCPEDILNAPENTLVLIDEIGTIFNSRDFSKKGGLPKILFQHICQCRKRKLQILATTQCWNFLDKQLRDITAYVITCSSYFNHPFSRMTATRTYDKIDYDIAYENPLIPCKPVDTDVFVQTDEIRALYDTAELIQSMLESEYISDEEILVNQGVITKSYVEFDKKTTKKIKKII